MIIFGTKASTKTVETGYFGCPVCGSEQRYEKKSVQKRGHLYFIPVIPMGDLGEYVECARCKETFRSEVLDASPSQDEIASYIAMALRRILVLTMMADGQIDESEISAIEDIYRNVYGQELSRRDIEREIAATAREECSASVYATVVGPYLNDNGKEMVIRAILAVAAADGRVDDTEWDVLVETAAGLGLTPTHIKGIMAEMSAS